MMCLFVNLKNKVLLFYRIVKGDDG